MKTSETKKFIKIFCEALKNILLHHLELVFILKKGFLNSQAVRIRVISCSLG
jgi:hypothetical protein